MTPATLALALPAELIAAILIELDIQDLVRCREVCTQFKALIDDDVRVQYKLELAVSGMQDNSSSPLTPAERLSILRARQKAWNEFAWTARENIPMRQGHRLELCGDVLAQSEGPRTLHLNQIPSGVRGIEGTEWTIPDVGCDITAFSMDPSQDLLVVIDITHFWDENSELTCRIYLRALSTGEPHPAGPPEGMLTLKLKQGPSSYFCQTSENHLGVLMGCEEHRELFVWDWKLGTLQLHLITPEISSWTFLTPCLIVVAEARSQYNENTGCMVYLPLLSVIELDLGGLPPSEPPYPVPLSDANAICTFHFPPLSEYTVVIDMFIQSDPKPTTDNRSPIPLHPGTVPPFSLSGGAEHRLFLLSVYTVCSLPEEVVLRALVPASTFLHALSNPDTQTRRDVAWAEWGERGARLFATPGYGALAPLSSAACDVHGTVFTTTKRVSDPNSDALDLGTRAVEVIVRDFNQLALRRRAHAAAGRLSEPEGQRQGSTEEGEQDSVRVVTDATVFEPARLFKEQVTTSLPYVERVLVLSQREKGEDDARWHEVIPTEDALVLTTSNWGSRFRARILSI